MYLNNNINWHEGLFLEPHHLQLFQKSILDGFSFMNRNIHSYYYGLIEADLSEEMLETGNISFNTLKAVMPNGIYLDIKENMNLNTINVQKYFDDNNLKIKVYLTLPNWSSNIKNTLFNVNDNQFTQPPIYVHTETSFNDENKGTNSRVIPTRKMNCSLTVEESDLKNCSYLPLISLKVTGRNRKIVIDNEFIPPCIFIDGSKSLLKIIDSFILKLNLSTSRYMDELSYTPIFYNETPKLIKPLNKSAALNEYYTKLSLLMMKPAVTPYEIFLELNVFYSRLCILTADQAFKDLDNYNHNNLCQTFSRLINKIEPKIIYIENLKPYVLQMFQPDHNNEYLTAKITEDNLKSAVDFVLGISTKQSVSELVKTVEEGIKFKVLSPNSRKGGAIPGLKLTYFDNNKGVSLPQKPGISYFKIEISEDDLLWQAVLNEKEIAIICKKEDLQKYKVELFTLLPEKEQI